MASDRIRPSAEQQPASGSISVNRERVERCNLCGLNVPQPVLAGRDRLHGLPGRYNLVRCENCGLIYLNPRPGPDSIAAYYPEDYLAFYTAIEDEPSWFRRLDRQYAVHKRCSQVIRRAGPAGRLLDVGCATGIFLNGMRQRGWHVEGLEPSPHAAAYARQRFGLEVREQSLEESGFPDEQFDVLTLWDVLEHVPDPAIAIAEAARILRPGGWLVLSLPNPASWERRWFGPYWAGWDVPRHFHIFSQEVLERYLAPAGFSQVEITSFTGRHGVLALSVQFALTEWPAPETWKRTVMRLVRSVPARVLTWPYYAVADRLNRSSIMTVFAQKGPST